MRALLLAGAMLAAVIRPADAGFDRWTIEREEDPFTKGERVTIDYMESIRSGVIIFCDTAKQGITVRSIPGFAAGPELLLISPTMDIAIDGVVISMGEGDTGSVGDNLAVSEVQAAQDVAMRFTNMFRVAKKQVAIKDGISDRPMLLSARGSTKAGQSLYGCLVRQVAEDNSSQNVEDEEPDSAATANGNSP